jgi:dipeptidyl aminopeptidase/acylaminoacyl peptidase
MTAPRWASGYQAGRSYPLVLHIHGGPRGASTLSFSARAQWLASHGWIVFQPNYRGSDNLGNTFQAAIWNDAGVGPGRDVMSGVDLLIQRGIADPARMAVSGWSYGGYMTAWLLGNYPDRWRAGVAGELCSGPETTRPLRARSQGAGVVEPSNMAILIAVA